MTDKIQFTMDLDDSAKKAIDQIQKEFEKLFSEIKIVSQPINYPTFKEDYSFRMRRILDDPPSGKSGWLGTIYYNRQDIEVDYIDSPSRPLPTPSGLTFVRRIL